MRATSFLFYAFAFCFACAMISGSATGHLRTTDLSRVLSPAFALSWLLGIHALTVYTWKRQRVKPPPELLRQREEMLYYLLSPRP